MVQCRCASICLQPFDETRLDCVSLLYTIIASDTCGLWTFVFVNTSVPACVSNTFILCPVSAFKHLSPALVINHVCFGALCRAQVSVSTRASNTFCGSWSVHIIGLQPFVSNTFDFGILFVCMHLSLALCLKHVWIVVLCLRAGISLEPKWLWTVFFTWVRRNLVFPLYIWLRLQGW